MSKEKMSRETYLKIKPMADDLRKAEVWCESDGVLTRSETMYNLYKMGYRKQSENTIELPCKVGDTVYYLNARYHMALYRNTIYEAKVARIVITSLGVALVIHIRDESGCCEVPDVKDFGKTVFLTQEEAEKALAERSRQ